MSDEKQCWVVTSGDYYEIATHGIYTTEAAAKGAVEAAEAVSDDIWGPEYDIECRALDTWVGDGQVNSNGDGKTSMD